jgi:hypothetical protein
MSKPLRPWQPKLFFVDVFESPAFVPCSSPAGYGPVALPVAQAATLSFHRLAAVRWFAEPVPQDVPRAEPQHQAGPLHLTAAATSPGLALLAVEPDGEQPRPSSQLFILSCLPVEAGHRAVRLLLSSGTPTTMVALAEHTFAPNRVITETLLTSDALFSPQALRCCHRSRVRRRISEKPAFASGFELQVPPPSSTRVALASRLEYLPSFYFALALLCRSMNRCRALRGTARLPSRHLAPKSCTHARKGRA